jgi:peptidoglycan/LPS O-acetylase OafA/YrhL
VPEQRIARYDKLDGLRAYSAIGIVLMHVLLNGSYELGGFVFDELIPSFADLVFLFMVISGFSLCCGYYEKIVNGQISLSQFYKKRFMKVWPFFAILCVLDFAFSPSLTALYELLADLTLCFGLIPNAEITVIGVGWFLGLVFVFYFLFPFFCYLLSDKRRAWFSVGVALLLNFLCEEYFDAGRSSIASSAVFFLAGGMIYLYRDALRKLVDKLWWAVLLCVAAAIAAYFLVSKVDIVILLIVVLITIYALRTPKRSTTVLCNPVAKKLSGLSMEIYLSHMVIFRVAEKAGLTHLLASDGFSYAIAAVLTIVGAILFSAVGQKVLNLMWKRITIKK